MTNATANAVQAEQNRLWYHRHCLNPSVHGPWKHAESGWRLVYEAKSAIRDQNPVFAARLLPQTGVAPVGFPGLVQRPAGVVVEVDKVRAGTVTVSVDVAGALDIAVLTPDGRTLSPLATATATRTTVTFEAVGDGLYDLSASLGRALVTALLIPVQREAEGRLREDSRANDGGFAFKPNRRPQASAAFTSRLALIIGKDAAAATGNRPLFARLDAAEQAVPRPHAPVALFPAHA